MSRRPKITQLASGEAEGSGAGDPGEDGAGAVEDGVGVHEVEHGEGVRGSSARGGRRRRQCRC